MINMIFHIIHILELLSPKREILILFLKNLLFYQKLKNQFVNRSFSDPFVSN